jgi:arylsulfatase A-like enzyme
VSRSTALLALLLLLFPPCAGAADHPNVVLVVIDTLRADHLGSYGYARPTSPRLDALAAGGVRFAHARATSSWTAPSVASILTGYYPANHGVELPASRLGPAVGTLAQAFQSAGYATAARSANPAFVSPQQGFNRGFEDFQVLQGGVATDDDVDTVPGDPSSGRKLKVAKADEITASGLAWVSQIDPSQPYFLYAHYFDPHGGYFPPPDYAKRFGVSPGSKMLTAAQRDFWQQKKPDAEELKTLESLYDAEIAFTDHEVGRLLDGLPQSRPTLILVVADHGEEFMDHGGLSHGRTLWEEMLRVPLLVSGTGVKSGVVVQEAVTIVDVWPTLAELAGVPPPPAPDGRSLAPSVRDGTEPAPRPLFADMVRANKTQEMLHRHAVVQGSWKLLQNMPDGYALYDLGTDPGERRDASAAEGEHAQALETMLTVRESRKKNLTGWRRRAAPTVALSEQDKERMRALGYAPE